MAIHKGTELNNVKETWDQNERNNAGSKETASTGNKDLDKAIKEEAEEYDSEPKENQLLGGDRATLNDD